MGFPKSYDSDSQRNCELDNAHRFEDCTPQSINFKSSDKNSTDYSHETRNFSNFISEPHQK